MKRIARLLPLLAFSPFAFAEGFLEEVIVTAEKRETTLQDTAIAVTAFSQDDLERSLINNNLDVQMAVPNMLMSKGFFTTANISIRGIGNLAVGAAADTGTGVHFNGVYLNAPRIFETEYFDTERVEILRGPQGTLYGRNTTAGVINVISKAPEEEFGGNFQLSYGNYSHTKIKGALNIPLTDNMATRFSVFSLSRDGFVDNIHTGNEIDDRDMYAVRWSTALDIGDNTRAQLTLNHFEEDSNRMRGSGNYCKRDPDGILGCLPNQGLPDESANTRGTVGGLLIGFASLFSGQNIPVESESLRPPGRRTVNFDFEPRYEADETIATLEINHDFENMTLTSLTGWHDTSLNARNDYDQTVNTTAWPISVSLDLGTEGSIDVNNLYQSDRSTTEGEQITQEFRLASNFDGSLNFLLGAFYLHYNSDVHYYVYSSALEVFGQFAGVPKNQRLFDNETNDFQLDTHAVFGELYWDLNDDIDMTFGIRYTDEKKQTDNRSIYLAFLDDPTAPDGGFLHLEDSWQELTGKFNVNYHLNDDVMIYATLSRSYKSGGFNPISPESPLLDPVTGDPGLRDFEPEFINAIEIGAKTRLFNNTTQLNVTYFNYDYADMQVSKITNQTSINENVDAKIQGLEAELIWAPDEHWTITSNLSWLDSELQEFATIDPADPNQMGTTENLVSAGTTNIYTPCGCSGIEAQLEGNQLPNSPEYSIYLQVRYAWDVSSELAAAVSTSFYYQDEFYSRIFNTQDDLLESWDVWNATASISNENANWYAEAWIRNIQDKDHITGQHLQDASVGLYRTFQLLEPRTFGVTFGYTF